MTDAQIAAAIATQQAYQKQTDAFIAAQKAKRTTSAKQAANHYK